MRVLRSNTGRVLLCGVALILLGGATRPLVPKAVASSGSRLAGTHLGPSVSFAVLGGLRQTVANFLWISAYESWEARDLEAVRSKFYLAVAIDPEEWFFWSNGARMMAYDFPRWVPVSSEADEVQARMRYATEAILWLESATAYFPKDYRVYLEIGMIRLHVLRDTRSAAAAFKAAWECSDAPFFTARVYAELMRKAGEPEIAYAWYCGWLTGLPAEAQITQAAIILPRIREIEASLQIVEKNRFYLVPIGS